MYLLICYHSPMWVRTAKGLVPAQPGDCVLFDPSFPQWYQGRDGGFVDDWLHVDGPAMRAVVQVYGIPLNTIMHPRDTEFVTPIFEAINRELRRREPLWRESIGLLLENLFLQLGRELMQQPAGLTPAEAERLDEFRTLRMHVHERMQEPWSVPKMARLASLSASRFALLYTRLLGVSPMADLIQARLRRARALLTDASVTVADAAARAGFGSLCHFSRLFRRHVGCPPRDYHRHLLVREAGIGLPAASGVAVGVTAEAEGKGRTNSEPRLSLQHSTETHGWVLQTGTMRPPGDRSGVRAGAGAEPLHESQPPERRARMRRGRG